MKKLFIIFAISILSVSVLASDSIPAVSNVAIDQESGCGAPARPGTPVPTCPTVTTLTFAAVTTGACDKFSAKFDQPNGNGLSTVVALLTIIKSTVEHCTLPQHAPMSVSQRLNLEGKLPLGPIMLVNSIDVSVRYRQ